MAKQTATLSICLLLLIGPVGLAGAVERDAASAPNGSSPIEWVVTWAGFLMDEALGALEWVVPAADPYPEIHRANSSIGGDQAAPVFGGQSATTADQGGNDDDPSLEIGPMGEPIGSAGPQEIGPMSEPIG